VVGLGDSYGSGEGVPDVPVTQLALEAVTAARAALVAAEAAFGQSLVAYTLAQQNLDDLLPLLNTAVSRYNAWVAAAQNVDASCGNFPPTPVQCASANAAFIAAGVELTAALAPLGLEYLFGEPTLFGVITNWRTSLINARNTALAVYDAAHAARDAAAASLGESLAEIRPRWRSRQCHRSAGSGQVQAAKRLEEADPRTSVTFIHLACSGAKIWKGLIGGYDGQEFDEGEDATLPPQVVAAGEITAGRELDALIVSIGGNDVRFAQVIESCAVKEPCYEDVAGDDPAFQDAADDLCSSLLWPLDVACDAYVDFAYVERPDSAPDAFALGAPFEDPDDHEHGLDDLPANYRALEHELFERAKKGELEGLFEPRGGARLFLTAYPGITRREPPAPGAETELCGFDPGDALPERLKNLPGLSLAEITWADTVVAPMLADTMRQSALERGWRYVDEHVASFDGHGYCADDNWIVRIPESVRAQVKPSNPESSITGSVHPNAAGHLAYASAIFAALLCDLYPACDPSAAPRAPRAPERNVAGTKLVISDLAAKAAKRKITLLSKSAAIETPAPGPGDPTHLGGALRIANSAEGGDHALLVLPAAGWRGLGKPAGSKGWQYKDPRGAHGPCTSVVAKPGKSLTATCKGAGIPFTLDEETQDSIAVSLTLGNDATLCMDFGGIVQRDRAAIGKKVGVFEAKNAPAPASCPLP
jgi:hypothetical protein